jgi:hypothetical protein
MVVMRGYRKSLKMGGRRRKERAEGGRRERRQSTMRARCKKRQRLGGGTGKENGGRGCG